MMTNTNIEMAGWIRRVQELPSLPQTDRTYVVKVFSNLISEGQKPENVLEEIERFYMFKDCCTNVPPIETLSWQALIEFNNKVEKNISENNPELFRAIDDWKNAIYFLKTMEVLAKRRWKRKHESTSEGVVHMLTFVSKMVDSYADEIVTKRSLTKNKKD